jgi:hypothetical protein
MSAYLVSRAHIDQLVRTATLGPVEGEGHWLRPFSFYHNGRRTDLNDLTNDAIGRMLWGENLASIHARYPDTVDNDDMLPGPIEITETEVLSYTYRHQTRGITPVAALKAIQGYKYQSCEHAGWKTSAAKAFCDALMDAVIDMLPGYNAVPWNIDSEPVESVAPVLPPAPVTPRPEVARLPAKEAAVPDMTPEEGPRLMKAALVKAFPGTKFSVRRDRGTAWAWINVAWTDGPSEERVRAITFAYQSAKFDGMTDGYDRLDNVVDGRRACYIDGISHARSFSPRAMVEAAARVGVRYGIVIPSPRPDEFTHGGMPTSWNYPVPEAGDYLGTLVWRELTPWSERASDHVRRAAHPTAPANVTDIQAEIARLRAENARLGKRTRST